MFLHAPHHTSKWELACERLQAHPVEGRTWAAIQWEILEQRLGGPSVTCLAFSQLQQCISSPHTDFLHEYNKNLALFLRPDHFLQAHSYFGTVKLCTRYFTAYQQTVVRVQTLDTASTSQKNLPEMTNSCRYGNYWSNTWLTSPTTAFLLSTGKGTDRLAAQVTASTSWLSQWAARYWCHHTRLSQAVLCAVALDLLYPVAQGRHFGMQPLQLVGGTIQLKANKRVSLQVIQSLSAEPLTDCPSAL